MPRQERAVHTKCELVWAAAVQFERNGFASTTLSGICRQVGVSSGALHFHFPSKSALADTIEQATSRALRKLISAQRRRQAGALQELVDVAQLVVTKLSDDQIIRAGVRLSQDTSRQATVSFREDWRAYVLELLAEARDDGSLAEGVSVSDAASAVMLATEGAMVSDDGEWSPVASMAGFWRLILPQLAAEEFAGRMNPDGTLV